MRSGGFGWGVPGWVLGAGAGACRSDEKMSRGGGGHVQ